MTISSKIRAMLGRVIYAVPADYPIPPVAACSYVPESRLPGDAAAMIRAEAIQPWRVDPTTGERWFRADAGAIENWSPHEIPMGIDDLDDEDFDDVFDPFTVPADDPDDDDDGDFDDRRNPYRWSGNP